MEIHFACTFGENRIRVLLCPCQIYVSSKHLKIFAPKWIEKLSQNSEAPTVKHVTPVRYKDTYRQTPVLQHCSVANLWIKHIFLSFLISYFITMIFTVAGTSRVIVASLGKVGIAASFAVSLFLPIEIFPTPIRYVVI